MTPDQVFHKFLTPAPNEKSRILPESTPDPWPPLLSNALVCRCSKGIDVIGTVLQCLFLFSIEWLYQQTPTLWFVVSIFYTFVFVWLSCDMDHVCERNTWINKIYDVMYCSGEVGYSRNRPAMLCLHSSAKILTALINIQVSKHNRGKMRAVESARKALQFRRSI